MKTGCEAVRDRILFLLQENKMNLHQLAMKSGMFYGTLNGIMRGRSKTVSLTSIVKIAGGFDMTPAEFIDDPSFHEDRIKVD